MSTDSKAAPTASSSLLTNKFWLSTGCGVFLDSAAVISRSALEFGLLELEAIRESTCELVDEGVLVDSFRRLD